MFRRFFQRDGQGQTPQSQGPEQPDTSDTNALLRQQAEHFLKGQGKQPDDDGVHRMAIRAGGEQKPLDDSDERAYGQDQGEHAEIARKALQQKDFKRSIYHLGLALADDPIRDEWLALLAQWIATVGSRALNLVPLNDEHYFATLHASQLLMKRGNTPTHRTEVTPIVGKNYHAKVAIHAYILASQGHVKEAIALIVQLTQVKPEIAYQLWLPLWQDQPGFADALPPEQIVALAIHLMRRYPGTYVFSERAYREIGCFLPVLRTAYTTYKHRSTDAPFLSLAFVYAMALRKIGSFEEAAHIARALPAVSYQTHVALAMAEDALGNTDASIAAYQQALTFQSADTAVRNDLGTLFLAQGKLSEALAYYEKSAQLDPSDSYQQAFAHIAYIKYLQESSEDAYRQLETLARHQSTASHLFSLLHTSFIGKLPDASESLINLMRTLKARSAAGELRLKTDAPLKVKISLLEAPGARLASKLMLENKGIAVEFVVAEVLSPDPRQPLRPVEYQLWHYEGMDPFPSVPPPDPAIAECIAALAQTPYALERWKAPAQALGQRLGQDALTSLLGVMVHPPTKPADWDEWDWIFALQLASTLTIAFLDTGWEGSLRKTVLTSLIYGPMDWSGAAALITMAVLAHQDKRITIEFDRICCDLWHFGPGSAEWPLEHAMVAGLRFVNSYSDEARKHINDYFARMREEQEQRDR